MPHQFTALTPNLVVADVARSISFYRDVLGFAVVTTVPQEAPFAFAIVRAGGVQIYLNSPESAFAEYPAIASHPIGGTLTLFIDVQNLGASHDALKDRVPMVMPLEKKWYGVTEFAFTDPDGYVITFAERN